jgi:hypothetical protein
MGPAFRAVFLTGIKDAISRNGDDKTLLTVVDALAR